MGTGLQRSASRTVRRVKATALAVAVLSGICVVVDAAGRAGQPATELQTRAASATTGAGADQAGVPGRVVVRDDAGVLATFTVGARTVTLRGPVRTFRESTTAATVTTTVWVRLLPQPFAGTVDQDWLAARSADTSADVLATAVQYTTGAPDVTGEQGLRIAGDASYGPLLADGTREEGSDFNDHLGVPWTYGSTVDRPEAHQYGALDCSGYVRSVFGYRLGLPMTLQPDGARLPRRAVQMADSAPGVVVVPDTGVRPTDLSPLLPGDLVFFDASTDDGTAVDHVGIHLGTDSTGAPRFLSSRKGADGPTMGDVRGRSTLSGTGLYATAFRAVRRL